MPDLDLDAIIDQHRPHSGTNHRCRACKEWAPCTTSLLAVKLAEVERERDAHRRETDHQRRRADDFEGRYETAHDARMHAEGCYRGERKRADAAEARLAAAEQQLLAIDRLHPYYVAAGAKWCSTCKATRWPCPTISTRPGALDAEVTDR